ncbi:SAM-dependent methyltransferase [Sinimarinibacterium thermocellulolyticum]|uniref:Methyltransferase domain-containing protein n=1 Tax=Sinimarinibacterium thermocellulolyticum TaxID=3170016 RepID=A0ABV2A675_9GAMM
MLSAHAQDVVTHYTRRHSGRDGLFGDQPFANYGYWTRDDLTLEQAAEALTEVVATAAGLRPGDAVLDVGAGYGAGTVIYAKRCRPTSIIAIDITPVRIEQGRKYIASQGLAEVIDLRLGNATAMDFADASFDKLVSVECAFHFDTRVDFLREAARVLRPGGTLALTDMIPRRGVDPARYLRGEKTLNSGICLDNPANAYDADVYARHLREAGFEALRIESIVEWTRLPFARRLDAMGEREGGERGAAWRRSAARLRELVELGEDYVLVVARRAR